MPGYQPWMGSGPTGTRESEVPCSHPVAPSPSALETPSTLLVPPEPSKGHSGMPATPSRLPRVPAPGLLSRWTVSPRDGLCPWLCSERLQAMGCRWRPRDTLGWASVPRGSQVPARNLCREPSPGPGLVDSEGEGRHGRGKAEWCGRSRRSPPWGQQGWAGEEDPALHHQAPHPTQEPSPASPPGTAWPSLGGGRQGGTHRQSS